MENTESNYDIMARQAQERFLTFDQQPIIRKFQLHSDPSSGHKKTPCPDTDKAATRRESPQ